MSNPQPEPPQRPDETYRIDSLQHHAHFYAYDDNGNRKQFRLYIDKIGGRWVLRVAEVTP